MHHHHHRVAREPIAFELDPSLERGAPLFGLKLAGDHRQVAARAEQGRHRLPGGADLQLDLCQGIEREEGTPFTGGHVASLRCTHDTNTPTLQGIFHRTGCRPGRTVAQAQRQTCRQRPNPKNR